MEKLVLADGTELNGTILPDGFGMVIFVYVTGITIMEGVTIFSDRQKTATIVAHDHGVTNTYEGFTELTAINNEFGNCNVVLRRQVNAT